MPDGTATSHLFRPKLLTVLSEGYSFSSFRKDVLAAVTVAIVALPLSMAIAVASGVSPERGLYTAIIGGFLVSALGGSRYQIGGPAGAFIVLVAATTTKFGLNGLLVTVMLSGALLTLIGLSRLGSLIRHIPHPVTVGFTCGIAVTIFSGEIRDLFGLHLDGAEPGPLIPKLVGLIFVVRRFRPNWPGMLIAVVLASIAAAWLQLPAETIGSRFGEIPRGLPTPQAPQLSWALVLQLLPSALSFTLLGGVESLLSAKVADSMSGRKHRSNMELVAQGLANIVSALFGGISVTGTIARTATNIRAGAISPLSGMMHALFVLLFMLVAAPLARYVPLSALAGVLLVVCWNMAEKAEFLRLIRSWPTALVLLATFGLTLVKDLTFGIVAGCVVAALLAMARRRVPQEGD